MFFEALNSNFMSVELYPIVKEKYHKKGKIEIGLIWNLNSVIFIWFIYKDNFQGAESKVHNLWENKKMYNFWKILQKKLQIGWEDIHLTQNTLLKSWNDCVQIVLGQEVLAITTSMLMGQIFLFMRIIHFFIQDFWPYETWVETDFFYLPNDLFFVYQFFFFFKWHYSQYLTPHLIWIFDITLPKGLFQTFPLLHSFYLFFFNNDSNCMGKRHITFSSISEFKE